MAQFMGSVSGQRGPETRLGSKVSGLTVKAQSWQGQIVTTMWHDKATGQDMVSVKAEPHGGPGHSAVILYEGTIAGARGE